MKRFTLVSASASGQHASPLCRFYNTSLQAKIRLFQGRAVNFENTPQNLGWSRIPEIQSALAIVKLLLPKSALGVLKSDPGIQRKRSDTFLRSRETFSTGSLALKAGTDVSCQLDREPAGDREPFSGFVYLQVGFDLLGRRFIMLKRLSIVFFAVFLLLVGLVAAPAAGKGNIGINVLLKWDVSNRILAELGRYGKVRDVVYELNAVTLQARADQLDAIRALPYVAAANPDAERTGAPVDTVAAEDFVDGMSTWNLDAINVTAGPSYPGIREMEQDGTGVYVAVLDTGLLDSWRQYFPEERIAEEYAISFGGGGGDMGTVSTQPDKWEHDQDSHGTHVTSTILGYSFNGRPVNGVAPMATVIPVKVLNQNGSGWSSVIARGINYIAGLKEGPLAGYPVVINMSLGGPGLDAMERAAIDRAISKGVIIVASAGNDGADGMGYPGAYAPVISVAAAGWVGEWSDPSWWYGMDLPEDIDPADYYIADFSSRALAGQDLDVAAPGSWVVGPYQINSGHISYYYLGGTSMASPHVAGVVALLLEVDPALTAADAEAILEGTALPIPGYGSDDEGAGMVDAAAALAAIL
jgi:subtilisin family serine protease